MKEAVLTLQQPWASAVFVAGKNVENRTWPTDYRGRLWIHAGRARKKHDVTLYERRGVWVPDEPLPRGIILGCVDLIDCVRGDPSPWALRGQWHWILANPRLLVRPAPRDGVLGIRFIRPPRGELKRARRSRKSYQR